MAGTGGIPPVQPGISSLQVAPLVGIRRRDHLGFLLPSHGPGVLVARPDVSADRRDGRPAGASRMRAAVADRALRIRRARVRAAGEIDLVFRQTPAARTAQMGQRRAVRR